MSIYFTSDLHLGHKGSIPNIGRPFVDVEDMNNGLISNWNETVTDEDDIYILGDLSFSGAGRTNEFVEQLNGRKHLLVGNHDEYVKQKSFNSEAFVWIKDYHTLILSISGTEQIITLFHYPIEHWNQKHYGSIHLHGHIHSCKVYNETNVNSGFRRYDIGVDANGYRPVKLDTVLEWAYKNPFDTKKHHQK